MDELVAFGHTWIGLPPEQITSIIEIGTVPEKYERITELLLRKRDRALSSLDAIRLGTESRSLAAPGHRLIISCARQCGKTTVIAVKAMCEALHNPKTSIMVLSRTKEHAALTIHKVGEFAGLLDIKRRR